MPARRSPRLLAAPEPPSGAWLYLEADGNVWVECGRCENRWLLDEGDVLEDILGCRDCSAQALGAPGYQDRPWG